MRRSRFSSLLLFVCTSTSGKGGGGSVIVVNWKRKRKLLMYKYGFLCWETILSPHFSNSDGDSIQLQCFTDLLHHTLQHYTDGKKRKKKRYDKDRICEFCHKSDTPPSFDLPSSNPVPHISHTDCPQNEQIFNIVQCHDDHWNWERNVLLLKVLSRMKISISLSVFQGVLNPPPGPWRRKQWPPLLSVLLLKFCSAGMLQHGKYLRIIWAAQKKGVILTFFASRGHLSDNERQLPDAVLGFTLVLSSRRKKKRFFFFLSPLCIALNAFFLRLWSTAA